MGDRASRDDISETETSETETSEAETSEAQVGRIKRTLADRLARGALPTPLAALVHRRLRRDPAWARWYDLVRRLERTAEGSPALSGAQSELIKRMLFAAPFEEEPAAQTGASRRWLVGGSLAAAAAAVTIVLVLTGRPGVPDVDDAWRPRGVSSSRHVGFRVRCVAPGGERVIAEAEAGSRPSVAPPALDCPEDGLLAFSATNLSEETAYFFVVGVNEAGEARWYAPFEAGAHSVAVPAGAVDEVMPALAGLEPMADDRRVALFAVFSKEPVSAELVAQAVRRAKEQGLSPQALSRLPLPASFQARVELQRLAARSDGSARRGGGG